MYVIMDLCIYGLSELNIAERLILLFHVVGLHCSMLPILICGFPLFFFHDSCRATKDLKYLSFGPQQLDS